MVDEDGTWPYEDYLDETTWHVIVSMWNLVATSWNNIAIAWNVMVIPWNLAITSFAG